MKTKEIILNKDQISQEGLNDALEKLAELAEDNFIPKWQSYDTTGKEVIQSLEKYYLDLHEGEVENPGEVVMDIIVDLVYTNELRQELDYVKIYLRRREGKNNEFR